jgi:Transglycosylase SLT domain
MDSATQQPATLDTTSGPGEGAATPDRPLPARATRRGMQRVAAVLAMGLAFALVGQAGAQASSGAKAYQSYAREELGGSKSQSSCLNQLWTAESGWNPKAQNPTSSAYGIAQFLNATWASTGIRKTSDPYRQIDAGLIYIGHRYGSPCKAWSFWQDNHWY